MNMECVDGKYSLNVRYTAAILKSIYSVPLQILDL